MTSRSWLLGVVLLGGCVPGSTQNTTLVPGNPFIAGAGDLYGTLEPPGVRYLTVNGQQFKPGEREKTLFNLS